MKNRFAKSGKLIKLGGQIRTLRSNVLPCNSCFLSPPLHWRASLSASDDHVTVFTYKNALLEMKPTQKLNCCDFATEFRQHDCWYSYTLSCRPRSRPDSLLGRRRFRRENGEVQSCVDFCWQEGSCRDYSTQRCCPQSAQADISVIGITIGKAQWKLCVCLCVYVYVCVYVCIHVCMFMCVYVCLCVFVCMCMCACMCVCMCVYVYVCMCMYACVYVCLYVCVYVCMYVCVYVYVCVCVIDRQ